MAAYARATSIQTGRRRNPHCPAPFRLLEIVRALAVTTKERSPLAPDVPTFAEQGFPGYEVVEELALFAPAGTPEPVLRRLNEATAAAFAASEVREKLAILAISPAVGRLEDWPAHFAAENRKWREVIRTRNTTLE